MGAALVDALDELINDDELTENLAMLVLCQFDRSVHSLLSTSLRNRATVKVYSPIFD